MGRAPVLAQRTFGRSVRTSTRGCHPPPPTHPPTHHTHSNRPDRPMTARAVYDKHMADGATFWWDHNFRFTPEEYFNRLVPVLNLPDHDWSCDG